MSNVTYLKLPDTRSKAIGTLKMMLDYAIIEGAELRLPMFVFWLRLARLEIMENVEGDLPHIQD